MSSFYTKEELVELGFKSIGDNVCISRKASIYSPNKMSFGNNVRIDDFCILSGNITIGNHVHISAFTGLYGGGEIIIGDYCGCSPRSLLLSASDDFSGEYMISPMVPTEFTNVTKGVIELKKYCQIGAGTIVMPNVTIGEGSVVGAMSFVKNSVDEWGIYAGVPVKRIKDRSKHLLEFSKEIV